MQSREGAKKILCVKERITSLKKLSYLAPWRLKHSGRENIMTENEIAKEVVDAAYHVHKRLGPGLLESVYETVLHYEIEKRNFKAGRQVAIPIIYDEMKIEDAFRADIVVENKVIIELKSVENVLPVHAKQLLTYLRLSDKKLGLLINFGAPFIKDGIKRIVNDL